MSPLCGVSGRYKFIGHSGDEDGGTVRIFLSLWLCSGGYGTVEMVRGGGPFFLCFLQFAVSSFGGWMSAVGILCYIFFFVGSFVVFLAVSYFTSC